MTFATLLTHLELSQENEAVCAVSADIASLMHADVVGIAACQPMQSFAEIPVGDVIEADLAEIARQTHATESQFRAAMDGKVRTLSWRSAATNEVLADYIAEEARSADLIVTGPDIGGSFLDNSRRTDIGSLVMKAGRPVLLVPSHCRGLSVENVVVAWKDTREARRALMDAIPLLKIAGRVSVVEIAPKQGRRHALRRTADVAGWLRKHCIIADAEAVANEGGEVDRMHEILDSHRCDLLVAGAFGHSRLREWVFGGMTRDLLLAPERCTLLSH